MVRVFVVLVAAFGLNACATATPGQTHGWDSVKYSPAPVAMHINTLPLQPPGIY